MSEVVLESYRETKKPKMDIEHECKQNYFDWLPTELIEYIIKECLSDLRDYCALSQVSRKFKMILDRLWKGYAQTRLTKSPSYGCIINYWVCKYSYTTT